MTTHKRSRMGAGIDGEGEMDESSGVTVQKALTQLAYSRETVGRNMPMSDAKAIVSRWSGAVQWVTYQWGRITDGALGSSTQNLSYQLKNQELQTLSVGTVNVPANSAANLGNEYPFHIFSLCNRQYFTTTGAVAGGDTGPGRFAYSDNVTGGNPDLKFGYLTSLRNNDGTTVINDWNIWSAYSSDAPDQLKSDDVTTSLLKDVQVDLLLQGATGAPTTFHIDFITVSDDDYGPDAAPSFARDEAYFPMIRKLLGNPLAGLPKPAKSTSTIRVFKSFTYYLAPGTSIDYDTTPPQRHVRIFLHPNKLIKWNWRSVDDGLNKNRYDAGNHYASTYQVQSTINPVEYPPDYRDRMFMIVRATNAAQGVTTGVGIPQYDLRLKTTHVFNANNSS